MVYKSIKDPSKQKGGSKCSYTPLIVSKQLLVYNNINIYKGLLVLGIACLLISQNWGLELIRTYVMLIWQILPEIHYWRYEIDVSARVRRFGLIMKSSLGSRNRMMTSSPGSESSSCLASKATSWASGLAVDTSAQTSSRASMAMSSA